MTLTGEDALKIVLNRLSAAEGRERDAMDSDKSAREQLDAMAKNLGLAQNANTALRNQNQTLIEAIRNLEKVPEKEAEAKRTFDALYKAGRAMLADLREHGMIGQDHDLVKSFAAALSTSQEYCDEIPF